MGRIHRAPSADGTVIAGRMIGSGPPLVLLHGGLGDGEISWAFMLPFLSERFTCFTMSSRGRGLSHDHPDHSRERHFEDVAAFVESVGEPVAMFGHSGGAVWMLGGALRVAGMVRALALYEPPVAEAGATMDAGAYERMRAAAAEGRSADALQHALATYPLGAGERTLFGLPAVAEAVRAYIPACLLELPEWNRSLSDVAVEELAMPMLLLHGSESHDAFKASVAHLRARIDGAVVEEVARAGHMGPVTSAEAVARALIGFFSPPR